MNNLSIAFPEMEEMEKMKIMKKFYKNLIDTFIETIKLISISPAGFEKRFSLDITEVKKLTDAGLTVQVHSGHQMNWEYAHLAFAKKVSAPWIGVYMPISNKIMNRLFLKIRSRFNAIMISAWEFTTAIRNWYGKQHMLALIADQNPGFPKNAQWLYFFSKPAPFVGSPEKGAIRNKSAVVFVNFIKIRRGYYKFEPRVIIKNAQNFSSGELTRKYRDFLEECITAQPDNYLWSHRRWKFSFEENLARKWIDTIPPQDRKPA